MKKGKAMYYDFGKKENLLRYGQEEPPEMNLTKSVEAGVPMTMCAMRHDAMLKIEGLRELASQMGPSVEFIELDGGHSTYFIGKDVSFMKDRIMPNINKYNPLV